MLGPCELYGGYKALNMENAWQYAKVYDRHTTFDGPSEDYFKWAKAGWDNPKAVRYPMGKGAKPEYSWWDGVAYSYIAARKKIYAPLYAKAVENTLSFKRLKEMAESLPELWLWDFDGYDHKALGMSYTDVLNCESKKMGHAFVLAMMLENQRVWK